MNRTVDKEKIRSPNMLTPIMKRVAFLIKTAGNKMVGAARTEPYERLAGRYKLADAQDHVASPRTQHALGSVPPAIPKIRGNHSASR